MLVAHKWLPHSIQKKEEKRATYGQKGELKGGGDWVRGLVRGASPMVPALASASLF